MYTSRDATFAGFTTHAYCVCMHRRIPCIGTVAGYSLISFVVFKQLPREKGYNNMEKYRRFPDEPKSLSD